LDFIVNLRELAAVLVVKIVIFLIPVYILSFSLVNPDLVDRVKFTL